MNIDFDHQELRPAPGQDPTGVTVILTVEPNGMPRGFTANSFTSVSLDQSLLLVWKCRLISSAPCSRTRDRAAFRAERSMFRSQKSLGRGSPVIPAGTC